MSISNNPPAYEAISLHIEDLIAEAHNFLDGEPIKAQGQADAVGKLLDMIRQAKKADDEQRVIENKPNEEIGRESGRGRGCQYVTIWGFAEQLKKKKTKE